MAKKTIRLLMPQWQGGNNPNYSFGAELLAWLAPENDQPLIHVPVQPYDGTPLENENGINGRKQLLEQLEALSISFMLISRIALSCLAVTA